eukprot:7387301-Prymnesium_polylepis.1
MRAAAVRSAGWLSCGKFLACSRLVVISGSLVHWTSPPLAASTAGAGGPRSVPRAEPVASPATPGSTAPLAAHPCRRSIVTPMRSDPLSSPATENAGRRASRRPSSPRLAAFDASSSLATAFGSNGLPPTFGIWCAAQTSCEGQWAILSGRLAAYEAREGPTAYEASGGDLRLMKLA